MGENYFHGSAMSTTPHDFEDVPSVFVDVPGFFVDVPGVFENVYIRAILIFIYAVVFLACFVGNLGVILVLAFQWKSKSLLKVCLWNLSMANLLVALFCIMQNLSLCLLGTWIFGELMCKMYHFITTLNHSASIIITTALSVKRYLALLHPHTCQQILTERTLKLLALATWILSAAISLPRFIFFGLLKTERNEQGTLREICVPINAIYNSGTADLIYFIVQYLLPILTLVVLYCRIGLFFWNSERIQREYDDKSIRVDFTPCLACIIKARLTQLNAQSCCNNSPSRVVLSATKMLCSHQERLYDVRRYAVGRHVEDTLDLTSPARSVTLSSRTTQRRRASLDDQSILHPYSRTRLSQSRRKERRKSFGMLLTIVVTFAVLNLPYHVRKLCIHFCPSFDIDSETNKLLAPLTFLLMFINCAVNSVVYAFSSKAFRTSSREFWSKVRRIVGEN